MNFKPMLACDWEQKKLKFPLLVQPKIDGVRALHLTGELTGRTLRPFDNLYVGSLFRHPIFAGLDGEMAAAESTHPLLCTKTTSALTTIAGEPLVQWWLFDYVTPNTIELPYEQRYGLLQAYVAGLYSRADFAQHPGIGRLRIVPVKECFQECDLNQQIAENLELGYEGTILRKPHGLYKQGRSTASEGGLLRVKLFIDAEMRVTAVNEGQTNNNEAEEDLLGHTKRSTHQENMTPNGMVGSLDGTLLADVVWRGEVILRKGDAVRVSAGSMDHNERRRCIADPSLLLRKICKFKLFPKGVMDKPRFPTFLSIRMEQDL